MSVYRRNYKVKVKGGAIETRTQPFFTIEIRHPETGKIVRRRGPKDKKSAKKMESDLLTALERGQAGLVDPYRESKGRPIQEAIDAFISNLESQDRDDMYVYTARKRLERLAIETGWKTLFEATQRSFEDWRTETSKKGWKGRPTKGKTLNQFLSIANEFFDWASDTGRLDRNPMAKVKKSREIANDDYRRAAKPEELATFLRSLPTDELRRFYIFVAYTPIRRSALATLRWTDLDLKAGDAFVQVRSAENKNRKLQKFTLRSDVAQLMREAKAEAAGGAFVFPHVPTIDEHREYLKAAGIPFEEGKDFRRLDLHAFRKTLITWMEDAGVDVREASKAIGHLHLSTTMKHYREKRDGRREAGVERLPGLIDNPRTSGAEAPERSG